MNFRNKNILIGITGSIAAYKACNLIRLIKKSSGNVKVILTDSGSEFITPVTLETLSENKVYTGMFDYAYEISHINLIKWSDCFVIYPASANTISKIACGIADNLLTSSVLSWNKPVIIAPAMNVNMYKNRAFQDNMKKLRESGHIIIEPDSGELACGDFGEGRLTDEEFALHFINKYINGSSILNGKKVLITTGPTIEDLDPARFISNRSSGKMGYHLTLAAFRHSADVTLISGPVNLNYPDLFRVIKVRNAAGMKKAVNEHFEVSDIIIKAAAVSDYKPSGFSESKIKKDADDLSLKLTKTDDILAFLGAKKGGKILVGFSVETENEIKNSQKKLKNKNLDMIVVNNPGIKGAAFETDTNIVTVISKNGEILKYPKMTKELLADILIRKIAGFLK